MHHYLYAGAEIVVEEFLDGEEVSFFALIDGETCLPLASAQVRLQISRHLTCNNHKNPKGESQDGHAVF